MQPADNTALKSLTKEKLAEHFGRVVEGDDADDPLGVPFPGLNVPVHVFTHTEIAGALLRIACPVTETADWSTGMHEFLVRESGNWIFGRPERWGDAIVIEHAVFADISGKQLAIVVAGLAHTAIRLERDLFAMGGLATVPHEG